MADDQALQFIIKMRDEASSVLAQFGGSVDKVSSSAKQAEEGLAGYARSLQQAAEAAVGAIASAETLRKSLSAFSEFEQGLLKLGRTGALSGDDLKGFGADVEDMTKELPQTTAELLKVADAAARAGISGRDNLDKFTKYVGEVAEVSDMSADQVATSLIRMQKALGLPVDAVEKLGNAFVALKDKTLGTPEQLLQMAQMLGRSLSQFNVSGEDTMGLAAGITNMGTDRAQASVMALSRTMEQMQTAMERLSPQTGAFAQALGMSTSSAKQFVELHPEQAFMKLIENLNNAQKSGQPIGPMLKDLGIATSEWSRALSPLAQNLDDVKDKQKIANDAAGDAAIKAKQLADAHATLSYQLSITGNAIDGLFKKLGEQLTPAVEDVMTHVRNAVTGFENWDSALTKTQQEGLAWAAATAPAFATVASALNILKIAIGGMGLSLAALAFNPITLTVLALSAAVAAAVEVWTHFDDIVKQTGGDATNTAQMLNSEGIPSYNPFGDNNKPGVIGGVTPGTFPKDRFESQFGQSSASNLTQEALTQSRVQQFALPQLDLGVVSQYSGAPSPNMGREDDTTKKLEAQIKETKLLAAAHDDYGKSLAENDAAIKQAASDMEKLGVVDQKHVQLAKDLAAAQYDLAHSTTSMVTGFKAFAEQYQQQALDYGKATQSFMTSFSSSIESTLIQLVNTGKVNWKSFIQSIIDEALKLYAIKPLLSMLFGGLSGGLGGASGLMGGGMGVGKSALGNVFGFAGGGAFTNGIFDSPTLFRFANGGALGMMGEAGPEAVMPLMRGSGGALGVSSDSSAVVAALGQIHQTLTRIASTSTPLSPGGGSNGITYSPTYQLNSNGSTAGQQSGTSGAGLSPEQHRTFQMLDDQIRSKVVDTIQQESRPGGMVDKIVRARTG